MTEHVTSAEGTAARHGDIGLARIKGFVGLTIQLGQWFNGDGSRWTHAYIVGRADVIYQAEPGGAEAVPLDTYAGREVFVHPELTTEQRDRIVAAAKDMLGTPYSFLDYLSIALHRFRIRPRFVERYVQTTKHMICSQLVDEAYLRAGVHLFADGRLPQDVTPGDLARLFHV